MVPPGDGEMTGEERTQCIFIITDQQLPWYTGRSMVRNTFSLERDKIVSMMMQMMSQV
jgi:hypothetical protein